MTVATQVNKVQAIGTGVTRTFSFSPMVIFTATDLVVITTIIATGVETVRTRGTGATNFLVNLTTFPGTGSIDFPADGGTLLLATERITIIRVSVLEQLTTLRTQGPYLPAVQEDQFDKIVMLLLQHEEILDRCLRVQRSELTSLDSELPSAIGNESRFVRVNKDGDSFDIVALTAVTGALSSSAPAQVVAGSPSSGSSDDISRADHAHKSPDIVLIGAFAFNSSNFT